MRAKKKKKDGEIIEREGDEVMKSALSDCVCVEIKLK